MEARILSCRAIGETICSSRGLPSGELSAVMSSDSAARMFGVIGAGRCGVLGCCPRVGESDSPRAGRAGGDSGRGTTNVSAVGRGVTRIR